MADNSSDDGLTRLGRTFDEGESEATPWLALNLVYTLIAAGFVIVLAITLVAYYFAN